MTNVIWAALCVALFFSTSAALAQDVLLRSLDGSVELEGDLLGFDGEFYRVDSVYGPLTIASEGVACLGPGCPDLEAFVAEARLAGAPAMAERLMPALLEAFALEREMEFQREDGADGTAIYTLTRSTDGTTAARFTVSSTSSDGGFEALLNDETDLALSLREPSVVEQRAAEMTEDTEISLSRRSRVVALDALVPVVSPANPVVQLSLPELISIYSGEITNWSDLGGPDAPIELHFPADGSGLAEIFYEQVMRPAEAEFTQSVQRHDDLRAISEAVYNDAYALGVTGYSAIRNARQLAISGACGFAQLATPGSLKAEDYPLTAPLFIYTPARRLPQLVREFMAFFESQTAERVVRRAGFVNQSITRTGVHVQGLRLTNAIRAAGDEVGLADLQSLADRLARAERLSPTFRFSGGEIELDAQSRSSVSRLARSIERGMFDGRRLVFVGFSDAEGSAEVNERLSRRRAEAARAAVQEAAAAANLSRVTMVIEAYGEAMPMACDDTLWGRAVNRRVEVWLE